MQRSFEKENITVIEKSSPDYPGDWKNLTGAPEKLYAVGNISLLQTEKFTIVGSRKTSVAVAKLTEKTAESLSYAFTLVTGVADGGDRAVIDGALKGSGRVICVLPAGFSAIAQTNTALFLQVIKKGLMISACPYEESVRNYSYEYRNKLLARLSVGGLIVSAGEKSGSLITAKYLKEQKKKVFAFPYFPTALDGAGCNGLIKQGAILTENAQDILSSLGVAMEEQPKITLNETEEKVMAIVRETGDAHITQIAERSGVPPFKLRAVLSGLEVKGVIVAIGGNRYAPV